MGVGRGVADACDRYKGVRTSAKVRGVRTHAKFFASTQKLSIAMLSSKRSHANLVLSDVRRDEYCISGTWTRNSPFQKGLRGFALRTLCSRNCVPRPPRRVTARQAAESDEYERSRWATAASE